MAELRNQQPDSQQGRIPRYKVLILHASHAHSRKTTLNHIYCYPAYRPGNLYAYHHLLAPISPELMSFPFDAVIINYCFLAQRDSGYYPELRKAYRFLSDTAAVKIAIPQDDYTLSEILDQWLKTMNIDLIYSAVSRDLQELYPHCSTSIPIRHVLTGYHDPQDLVRVEQFVRPFRERPIDVGTRVRRLPPWVGRAAFLKGRLAERFRDAAREAGFVADISTRPEDVFAGDDWFRFLGSCRFAFVTKSGASLNDPRGAIRARVDDFLRTHPEAPFDEVEAACFPGLDGHDFSAVSARLFDAAAARTGLILLEDKYVDGLEPYRHYIPLQPDFSNLDEVFALMRDEAAAQQMIEAAHRFLVQSDRFSYGAFVGEVLAEVAARRPRPRPATAADFANLRRHYEQLAAGQRLMMAAPPHWSQVARLAGNRAQRQGQLASLAGLVATRLGGTAIRSVIAAEMACGGRLDPGLAGAAAEAINGLAGDPQALEALRRVLANAAQIPGHGNIDRDWGYCEYVYDPALQDG